MLLDYNRQTTQGSFRHVSDHHRDAYSDDAMRQRRQHRELRIDLLGFRLQEAIGEVSKERSSKDPNLERLYRRVTTSGKGKRKRKRSVKSKQASPKRSNAKEEIVSVKNPEPVGSKQSIVEDKTAEFKKPNGKLIKVTPKKLLKPDHAKIVRKGLGVVAEKLAVNHKVNERENYQQANIYWNLATTQKQRLAAEKADAAARYKANDAWTLNHQIADTVKGVKKVEQWSLSRPEEDEPVKGSIRWHTRPQSPKSGDSTGGGVKDSGFRQWFSRWFSQI